MTLASGLSVGSTEPEVMLGSPTYGTTLSAEGNFTVSLGVPAASDLLTVTCGAKTYQTLRLLTDAVSVRAVPEPTQAEEFLAAYNLGPSDNLVTNAVWVYEYRGFRARHHLQLYQGGSSATVKLTLGPVGTKLYSLTQDAVWFYSAGNLELNATCTLFGSILVPARQSSLYRFVIRLESGTNPLAVEVTMVKRRGSSRPRFQRRSSGQGFNAGKLMTPCAGEYSSVSKPAHD